jgi:hypothetical protein
MSVIEGLLILTTLIWIGCYWRLAWTKGSPDGPSYLKIFFPILLFFESSWSAGTEIIRIKLQVVLVIIVAVTIGTEYVGLV